MMPPYLKGRTSLAEPQLVLALLSLYALFGAANPHVRFVPLAIFSTVLAILLRAPRWCIYLLALTGLGLTLANDVFVEAVGAHDGTADRDDAVELGCTALLHGKNPWSVTTALGNPISTGPFSLAVALPFVRVFGRINELTFCFWLAVALVALRGDVLRRNGTFLLIVPVLQLGLFDLHTTRYWSLDELAFAVLLFPLAWRAVERGRHLAGGAVLGLAILSRASYVFPVVGFLTWVWAREVEGRTRRLVLACAGCGSSIFVTVASLYLRFRTTIGSSNPLAVSLQKATWRLPHGNVLTDALTALFGHLPASAMAMARAGVALLLTVACTLLWTRSSRANAMVGVTIGNFFAFTVVHYGGDYADNFTAPLAVSALLAVAYSSREPAAPSPAF